MILYRDTQIPLFNSSYNTTINNERGVELPFAEKFISLLDAKGEDFIEIGCVTPYYFSTSRRKLVIDPTDSHPQAVKKDAIDCEYYNENIVSISTIEHVGYGDYGLAAEKGKSIELLNKILAQCKDFFITLPFGFNLELDKYILNELRIDYRLILFFQRQNDALWTNVAYPTNVTYPYRNGSGANSIVILSNLL
jgi:hypothetical protein